VRATREDEPRGEKAGLRPHREGSKMLTGRHFMEQVQELGKNQLTPIILDIQEAENRRMVV
jgi:hypothetical protein